MLANDRVEEIRRRAQEAVGPWGERPVESTPLTREELIRNVSTALAQAEWELAQAHVCPACGETTIAQDSALVIDLRAEVDRLKAAVEWERNNYTDARAEVEQLKADKDVLAEHAEASLRDLARVRAERDELANMYDESQAEVERLKKLVLIRLPHYDTPEWEAKESELIAEAAEMTDIEQVREHYVCAMLNWSSLLDERDVTQADLARTRAALEEARDEILYWRSVGCCYEEGWSRVLARIDGAALEGQ